MGAADGCHVPNSYRIVELPAPAEELIVKLIQAKSEVNISVRGTDEAWAGDTPHDTTLAGAYNVPTELRR